MYKYSFIVDKELCLLSWDRGLEKFPLLYEEGGIGSPYYMLFPRISTGQEDTVSVVLHKGEALSLQGYRLPCCYGESLADIAIEPVKDSSGNVIAARVNTEVYTDCPLSAELRRSQPLIDIGKESISLAHGVRNPLNAIKGAVVYLQDKYRQDSTFVEFSKIMEEEIVKLETFITGFLSTAYKDRGKSKTDIPGMLDRIVTLVSMQANSRQVELLTDYGCVPPLEIDSFQFEHAILNIINNSLEAMVNGGSITLRTSITMSNGKPHVVMEVVDTGPGMGQGDGQEASSSDISANKRGRGFGLFITREVVQYHGGHLEIKSVKGIGTVISMFIPIPLENTSLGE